MAMAEITMYGADWCGDCHRAQRLLERLDVAFRYVDVEHDSAMAEEARQLGRSTRIPVVVLPGERILVEPSDPELEAALAEAGVRTA